MHGPSFLGDGQAALHALADDYDRRAADHWHLAKNSRAA
jgi:hypothetical protein